VRCRGNRLQRRALHFWWSSRALVLGEQSINDWLGQAAIDLAPFRQKDVVSQSPRRGRAHTYVAVIFQHANDGLDDLRRFGIPHAIERGDANGRRLIREQVGENRRKIDQIVVFGNVGHVAGEGNATVLLHLCPLLLE